MQRAGDQSRDFVYVNKAVDATCHFKLPSSSCKYTHKLLPENNQFFVKLDYLVKDADPSKLLLIVLAFSYGRGFRDETRKVTLSCSMQFKQFLELSSKFFEKSRTAVGIFLRGSRARRLTVATLSPPIDFYARVTGVTVDKLRAAFSSNAKKESYYVRLKTSTCPKRRLNRHCCKF